MFSKYKRFVACLFLLGTQAVTIQLKAVMETNFISATVDTTKPGVAIPDDFLGLSFEAAALLPDENGQRYFRPDNQPLVNLFHTLGIKSLRIGGNTSDRDAVRLPADADIDSLFAFARLANVKVIYCLRLCKGSPAEAAKTAKYISDRYGDLLDCFSIGQEPSAYPVEAVDQRPASERMGVNAEHYTYSAFRDEWRRFAKVILETVPNAKFCGPGVHNQPKWTRDFLADFGQTNHVVLVTAHQYPGLSGNKLPSPEIGRAKMLSGEFFGVYQKLLDGSMPSVRSNSLPFRLEEANNYYNGGAKDVSDTYTAALWGLEYLHWWASHGAAGINFHTGDRVAAGANITTARYTAFVTVTNGISARPLAYGIQMFDLAGHGRYVPVKFEPASCPNLSTFATLNEDRSLSVTVINKSYGGDAKAMDVNLSVEGYQTGKVIQLSAPNGDVAARSGVSLGDSEIRIGGTWKGRWKPLPPTDHGRFQCVVPATSAVVILFTSPPI